MAKRMPEDLTALIQYMLEQQIRFGTKQQYNSGNNHYIKFCNKYDIQLYPITEEKWMYYIADALRCISANSIKTYITTIKHHAKINGFPVNTTEMPKYKSLYSSLNKVFGANDTKDRKPFTFDMIKMAYKCYNMRLYNELLMYTAIVCGMVALMRPSEFVALNTKVSPFKSEESSYKALFVRNCKCINKSNGEVDYYTITCRNVKTHVSLTSVPKRTFN